MNKIKMRFLIAAVGMAIANLGAFNVPTRAKECPDVRVVFAGGSGSRPSGENDDNYLQFKNTILNKIRTTNLRYEFTLLDYPAVPVGMEHLETTAGAYFSGGEAYDFGRSVEAGRKNLTDLVNNGCPNTKYVLGGYSQGAMVISKALPGLRSEKIIYAATFGDPKLYLPEGAGLMPAACKGKNLSDYRAYVPDCRAHKGKLGTYIPYEPIALTGKVGTWCNKRDYFCSSGVSMSDHSGYKTEGLYEDASRVIFDKIADEFNFENTITSPHDTAIIVDVSNGMDLTISRNAGSVVGLTDNTIARGGRVALYSYNGNGIRKKYCGFNECTADLMKGYLEEMRAEAEAANTASIQNRLMTSSFQVMSELTWQNKATKSLVAITNKKLITPDLNGTNLDTVVRLSKQIDPVNFYILADAESAESYTELVERTDGMVAVDEMSTEGEAIGMERISERILGRVDSLPRVEELEEAPTELPQLKIKSVEWVSDTEVEISFETNGVKTMVALNDGIMGFAEEKMIRIGELDRSVENIVRLVVIGEDSSSETVEIELDEGYGGYNKALPKAPNTGRV